MNIHLSFDIIKDGYKAEFIADSNKDLIMLLDTGAETPVWCDGLDEFKNVFPNAIRIDFQYILAGFGIGYEVVDAYQIPEFKLSDGKEEIVFENLPIVVTDRPTINASLILPGNIFNHMIIRIDRMSSSTYPTIEIESYKNRFPIFFRHVSISARDMERLGTDKDKIMTGVYLTKG